MTRTIESNVDRSPKISGYAIGSLNTLKVDDINVQSLTLQSRRGSVEPSIAEGRIPSTSDEIALGTETMRRLGVNIGDVVPVTGDKGKFEMRVVGRVAIPPLFFSFARPGQ